MVKSRTHLMKRKSSAFPINVASLTGTYWEPEEKREGCEEWNARSMGDENFDGLFHGQNKYIKKITDDVHKICLQLGFRAPTLASRAVILFPKYVCFCSSRIPCVFSHGNPRA